VRADPLRALLELADVAPAVERARGAVGAAYRTAGRGRPELAAEVGLRAAVASAALSGSRYDLATVRTGTVTDPVLQGALRVAAALPGLAPRWPRAPRQVLARLHLLAARGAVGDGELGRPVADPAVTGRIDALVALVTGGAEPGLVRAAVVHGELLALRAFPGPYGVVARAAARVELISSGLDPDGLIGVELGHLAREPEYVGAAGAFATGTPDGVRAWLRHCARAIEVAAADVSTVED
jgi:hypothetical protein